MIPHQNCVLQSGSRYFWCVSVCYKSEQMMTFVEVEKTEKFSNGKVVSVNYAIKRYQNGMFIVSYPRSVLNDKTKENVVRITDTYDMKISNSEMNLVLKKEMSYAIRN